MRRAALYGAPQFGAEWQKCYSALSVALNSRFGKGRVWERSTKYYEQADVAEEADIAIIMGLRGEGLRYLEHHTRVGTPTLVVDLGWMRRERNYWQVSPFGLNNVPKIDVPSDRFDKLDLKVFKPRSKDLRSIVVVGQLPGDMQHDLVSEDLMLQWGKEAALKTIELTKKRVFWRPHPRWQTNLPRPIISSSSERTLHDLIQMEGLYAGVVYNSSMGIDLLRLGCNVVALGPRTVYTDIVHTELSGLLLDHPGSEIVHNMLCKVAYGQYTTSELNHWSTLEHLLDLHQINGDW